MNFNRKNIIILGSIIACLVLVRLLLATPTVPVEDLSPVEVALGAQVGRWLGPDTVSVLVVDTDWTPPHLRKLAAARLAGLREALPQAEIEVISAAGIDDRPAAWERARDRMSTTSSVVAFFGIPSPEALPTMYRKIAVVGDPQGSGLPKGVERLHDCLLVQQRPSPLSVVGQASWQGTAEDRFVAAYEILAPSLRGGKTP